MGTLKSSYVKEILINEYGNDTRFHKRPKKNYVGAAFISFDITDEQFILHLAPRLSKHIKEVLSLNWCPTMEQLLEEESVSQLLLKLSSAMNKKLGHKNLLEKDNLVLYVLKLHNRKKNALEIHGITISKELIDMLRRYGICISYNDLLLLNIIWALRDAETSKTCPRSIALWERQIVILNNNDFKINSLTGNATGAHRTNIIYVQLKSNEEESNNDSQQLKMSPRRNCQKNWM